MKPKHLNQQNIQYVIERLAAWSHNYDVGRCVGWSQSRAHQAIQELGREGALEVEALMYFGRGDYDSFPGCVPRDRRQELQRAGGCNPGRWKGHLGSRVHRDRAREDGAGRGALMPDTPAPWCNCHLADVPVRRFLGAQATLAPPAPKTRHRGRHGRAIAILEGLLDLEVGG